jgi:hypothetical protein
LILTIAVGRPRRVAGTNKVIRNVATECQYSSARVVGSLCIGKGLAFRSDHAQIEVMANKGNTRIARDARLTAEADFATWLMMAKLGSFDDLPKEAQAFLSQYRERLKSASEKDAAAATIDAVYAAYYAKRGGKGTPPPVTSPPNVPEPASSDNIVRLQDARRARAARATQSTASKPAGKRRMPVLLIFIGLVAVVVAIRFLMGGIGR